MPILKLQLDEMRKELSIGNQDIDIYFDLEHIDEIVSFALGNPKRIRRCLYEMLNGRYNNDLYGKESFSDKTKNITAIKIKGSQNLRLYCKEYLDETTNRKRIVLIKPYPQKKASQSIDKKLRSFIETLSEIEYEFQE